MTPLTILPKAQTVLPLLDAGAIPQAVNFLLGDILSMYVPSQNLSYSVHLNRAHVQPNRASGPGRWHLEVDAHPARRVTR
jgi:hypothetical protein